MRTRAPLAVAFFLSVGTAFCCAAGIDGKPFDMEKIQALEARATQAQPREQCFLYAELVHQMTEVSLQQYATGNVDKATDLLMQVRQLAQKIHLSLANKDKRLKDAEILLNHTAFRLNEMLHDSSYQDRPLVESALSEVNQAENEAMMQVFRNK